MAQTLAALLRSARERAELTRGQLAERTGLRPNHILRLETPENEDHDIDPRFTTIALIAGELGLSLDELAAALGHRRRLSVRQNEAQAVAQLLTALRSFLKQLIALETNIRSTIATLESLGGTADRQSAARRKQKAKRRR